MHPDDLNFAESTFAKDRDSAYRLFQEPIDPRVAGSTWERIALAHVINQHQSKPDKSISKRMLKFKAWPTIDAITAQDVSEMEEFANEKFHGVISEMKFSTAFKTFSRRILDFLFGLSRHGEWKIPIEDFPYSDPPSFPEGIYDRHPLEHAKEIETLTRTRLKAGENPLWYIDLYLRFRDEVSDVTFAEFCQAPHLAARISNVEQPPSADVSDIRLHPLYDADKQLAVDLKNKGASWDDLAKNPMVKYKRDTIRKYNKAMGYPALKEGKRGRDAKK